MAEAYSVDTTRVQAMNDQLWRRVGVTQAFEILLVEAALVGPALPADVSKTASQKLSGGAARFWDLSVAQLQRDLCRRRILSLTDDRSKHIQSSLKSWNAYSIRTSRASAAWHQHLV